MSTTRTTEIRIHSDMYINVDSDIHQCIRISLPYMYIFTMSGAHSTYICTVIVALSGPSVFGQICVAGVERDSDACRAPSGGVSTSRHVRLHTRWAV